MDGSLGGNTVIQCVKALVEHAGSDRTRVLLKEAGRTSWLDTPPSTCIPEGQFHALTTLLRERFGHEDADRVLSRAGELTARYVLEHKMPRAVQAGLKALPRSISLRLLLRALGRNAKKFVGSGSYRYELRPRPKIQIYECLHCAAGASESPQCVYLAKGFEVFVRELVAGAARVEEIECRALGGACCTFAIHLQG